jgi:hypothetical protein
VTLEFLQDEIADALEPLSAQIPGLQVYRGWLDNPTPPQIDIYPPPGLFLSGGGFGPAAKQVFWTVRLRVNMADPPAAQQLLLSMLDPSNPASVTVALERVAAEPAEVSGFHQYADDSGEERLLGCEWTVSQFLR